MLQEDSSTPSHPAPAIRENRLRFEKSPYLLQHAKNPVDWYPWGTEAFSRAADEEKPVFLSIGYATCHWCHVMAHESFEDHEVAVLLNRDFICIKVDREERPDIDSVYMAICQQMTGQGGWPLTIIMTPEKKPFFAATYIPKETRFSMRGLLTLLPRISSLWNDQRTKLVQSADRVIATISPTNSPLINNEPGEELLDEGYNSLLIQFDPVNGGFGTAPKFPTPHTLLFLLRYANKNPDSKAMTMVEKTLDAICNGGIYDHLGGGVHRYSTDTQWLVPHFEKMLYDQALLLMACSEMFQVTKNKKYEKTAEEIIGYVMQNLRSKEGAFYSAEDADSPEGEGAFYVWTLEEFKTILGREDASLAAMTYGVIYGGNFSDPERGGGYNILSRRLRTADIAASFTITEPELSARIDSINSRLLASRNLRLRPAVDDKILADWNGLFIAALAQAARIFQNKAWCEAAKIAMQFILSRMRTKETGLLHRYRDGDAAISGFADDYAFIIYALIELYSLTFDVKYLSDALQLNTFFIAHFRDEKNGGFFMVGDNAEALVIRKKEIYDGAIPSANSVAFMNLVRLFRLTGDPSHAESALSISRCFGNTVVQSPSAYTWFLCGLYLETALPQDIVIVGERKNQDTRELLSALRTQFLPSVTIQYIMPGSHAESLADIASFTRNLSMIDGKATAYVCSGHACSMPVTGPEAMLASLGLTKKS